MIKNNPAFNWWTVCIQCVWVRMKQKSIDFVFFHLKCAYCVCLHTVQNAPVCLCTCYIFFNVQLSRNYLRAFVCVCVCERVCAFIFVIRHTECVMDRNWFALPSDFRKSNLTYIYTHILMSNKIKNNMCRACVVCVCFSFFARLCFVLFTSAKHEWHGVL